MADYDQVRLQTYYCPIVSHTKHTLPAILTIALIIRAMSTMLNLTDSVVIFNHKSFAKSVEQTRSSIVP